MYEQYEDFAAALLDPDKPYDEITKFLGDDEHKKWAFKKFAYNIVQLNLDTGQGVAIVRLQHPQWGGNWGPDSFTYRNTREGKITFSLALDTGEEATEA